MGAGGGGGGAASAPSPPPETATTDTLLAFWPDGQVRRSDVLRFRSSRSPLFADSTSETLNGRDWVERTVIAKRLSQIAAERHYATHPDFLAIEQRVLDQQFRALAYEADIQPVPEPTAEEIAKAYEERRESYGAPERVMFRYIYFDTTDLDEKAVQAKRKQAQTALEQARKGADFAGLSRQCSDLEVEDKDRVFGPVARGQLWPQVEDGLFSLKPGEVSPLIETPTGFHILKLVSHRLARQPPPRAEIHQTLRDELLLERRAQRREELLAELRKKFPVVVDKTLTGGPDWALLSRSGRTAIRVGPWSMTCAELFEAGLEADVSLTDPTALAKFVEDQVERRLLILRGEELDGERRRARQATSKTRESMLRVFTLDQLAREKTRVEEGEVDAYYLRNLWKYARPETFQVRHIEVCPAPAGPGRPNPISYEEAHGIARQISAAVSQGQPPGEMAWRYGPQGVQVKVGSDLTVSLGGQPRSYRRKVDAVRPGQASEPIVWPPGWLIVQVVSRSPGGYWPLQDIRFRVRRAVEQDKIEETRTKVRRPLAKTATYTEAVSSFRLDG